MRHAFTCIIELVKANSHLLNIIVPSKSAIDPVNGTWIFPNLKIIWFLRSYKQISYKYATRKNISIFQSSLSARFMYSCLEPRSGNLLFFQLEQLIFTSIEWWTLQTDHFIMCGQSHFSISWHGMGISHLGNGKKHRLILFSFRNYYVVRFLRHTLNSISIFDRRIRHKWLHALWSMAFGALLNLSAASIDCKYCVHSSDSSVVVSFGSFCCCCCCDAITCFAIAAKIVGDWHDVKRPFGRRLQYEPSSSSSCCVLFGSVCNLLENAICLINNGRRHNVHENWPKLFIELLIFCHQIVIGGLWSDHILV